MFSSTTSAEVPHMCNFVLNHFYLLLRCFLAGHDRIVLCLLARLFESGLTLKPGFHMIVRVVPVAPVFSNYVQATGTIIWKHDRDDHERSIKTEKTEKTGTTAVAWIENFLSGRPKRSRETVNILMETHFRATGTTQKTETTQNIPQCAVLCSVLCSKNGWINRIIFIQRTFYGINAEIRLPI